MSTTISEKSFGARLQKGYTIQMYTTKFSNYSPPREEDSSENLKILLDLITQSNAESIQAGEAYSQAVAHRQKMFKTAPISASKLLSPINGAVQAAFGKNSVEYKIIANINKKIRSSHVEKAPVNPDDPDAKKKISDSTRSYGSITQLFKDIITNVKQFKGYKPTNKDLSTEALESFSTSLSESNDNVALTFQQRSGTKATRLDLYAKLKESIDRIKAYTKSEYGNNSNEHKLIKGIKI